MNCESLFPFEIIISDNCSSDDTKEIVNSFARRLPIKYFRNTQNIGVVNNIIKVSKLASNKFIWLVGDDDILMPNSFSELRKNYNRNQDVDGLIVCHFIVTESERSKIANKNITVDQSKYRSLLSDSQKINRLDKFEYIYIHTSMKNALNFMPNIVISREQWILNLQKHENDFENENNFDKMFTAFFHTCMWGDILIGRPVGVISAPIIAGFLGKQDFLSKWPVMTYVFFLEISEYFLSMGAEEIPIGIMQDLILGQTNILTTLLSSTDSYTRNHFSLRRLLFRYGDRYQFKISLYNSLKAIENRWLLFKYLAIIMICGLINFKAAKVNLWIVLNIIKKGNAPAC